MHGINIWVGGSNVPIWCRECLRFPRMFEESAQTCRAGEDRKDSPDMSVARQVPAAKTVEKKEST